MLEDHLPIDKVRASRAGHTFHERWAARRALSLIFPQDDLCAIAIEGFPSHDPVEMGSAADDVADLIMYYGSDATFSGCSRLDVMQFKYRTDGKAATSSYLKKTLLKFAYTILDYEKSFSLDEVNRKLSFSFVTNCDFEPHLWEAIRHLKGGEEAQSHLGIQQLNNLVDWISKKNIDPKRLFSLTHFQASTECLSEQNKNLRRTLSNWSSGADGRSRVRLLELIELVRKKAGISGQKDNLITREDILDALECDLDDLFPADTRFLKVENVIKRPVQDKVSSLIVGTDKPVILHADGGVGKTVFVQSLAVDWSENFEVLLFDCFGGGSYRSEDDGRHLPRIGLIQIANELSARGLCDPILPSDSDTRGVVKAARNRLEQASKTVALQSKKLGILIVIDAADNAQIEADHRKEEAFPQKLLASLSERPIDGVKLLLTSRTHRMSNVVDNKPVETFELPIFSDSEIKTFLKDRKQNLSKDELASAIARSGGNARVLDYLVDSWINKNESELRGPEITVEELIAKKCDEIVSDLFVKGWQKATINHLFAALALLPPPVPIAEFANAMGWTEGEVRSALSDLAPMLETISHGAIFRDEPTETYIRDTYSQDKEAQKAISLQLLSKQGDSVYAAMALPRFLEAVGDVERAFDLAETEVFPSSIQTEFGKRRLKLARLQAAFSLATNRGDFDRLLKLCMHLSQVAAANSRGDDYVRQSPAVASILGDDDAFRRLLEDRSGWQGAKNSRLALAYCFLEELDEAFIQRDRAAAWINWYFRQNDDGLHYKGSSPKVSDFASVLFYDLLTNRYEIVARNLNWLSPRFAQKVALEVVELAFLFQRLTNRQIVDDFLGFVSSSKCTSLNLKVAVLSVAAKYQAEVDLCGVAKSAGQFSAKLDEPQTETGYDDKRTLEAHFCSASFAAIAKCSRQSAKRILRATSFERPSKYEYGERHNSLRKFSSYLGACLSAWTMGREVTFHDLLPREAVLKKNQKRITSVRDARRFMRAQETTYSNAAKDEKGRPIPQKTFSDAEIRDTCSGIETVIALISPVQDAILQDGKISANSFHEHIKLFRSSVRDVDHHFLGPSDYITRHVGLGFAKLLLEHSDEIRVEDAKTLIAVISKEVFSISDRLDVLQLVALRPSLQSIAGEFASEISEAVTKDEYIEQRGSNHLSLAKALLPLGHFEAREYYKEGLLQLDQMGGDDYELVYSVLRYAEAQTGGDLPPELSQRLMNLSQIIAYHEPSKFAWRLYSNAAANSIGHDAIYKFLRWSDQDVAHFSYGLPQLVCFLAAKKKLCPKRAAAILLICEDHGWHEWQVGDGLSDILSVCSTDEAALVTELIIEKLKREHSNGGWHSLWTRMVETLEEHESVISQKVLNELREFQAYTKRRQDEQRYNSSSYSSSNKDFGSEGASEDQDVVFLKHASECTRTDAASIDEALNDLSKDEQRSYGMKERFVEKLFEDCPVSQRVEFIHAMCEVTGISFHTLTSHIVEHCNDWSKSSAYFRKNKGKIVTRILEFQGSRMFELKYSGVRRQVEKLTEFCGSSHLVAELMAKTLVAEKIELDGDEWLEVATCLTKVASAPRQLEALTLLLSSSFAQVADDIGEGLFVDEFVTPDNETRVVADVFWHLLGDPDSFVRWDVARAIEGLVALGLDEEVGLLLENIGSQSPPCLRSQDFSHALNNAEQWLLIGLARASCFHPKSMEVFAPKLWELSNQSNIHIVSRVLIARSLTNIWKGTDQADRTIKLWEEINIPAKGYIFSDEWPTTPEASTDFGFDHDFERNCISDLAEMFRISNGQAHDEVVSAIRSQWPTAKSMNDFVGRQVYRRRDSGRHETFRAHIQRHAYLKAATNLAKDRPVAKRTYSPPEELTWVEWLDEHDLQFEDGTWLSDRKDEVPDLALNSVMNSHPNKENSLVDEDSLFERIGLVTAGNDGMLPIFGTWRSDDGVNIRIVTALTKKWGAIKRCKELAKLPDHSLWIPTLASDGKPYAHQQKNELIPWIWTPESYRSGIDEQDMQASRSVVSRPKLGPSWIKDYELVSWHDGKYWSTKNGDKVLRSLAWGRWESGYDGYVQIEGKVLKVSKIWLDEYLSRNGYSLACYVHVEKYQESRSYSKNKNPKYVGVGLISPGQDIRIWKAKLASEQ